VRVAIVGGSLGGLFAAVLLRQAGHQVRLYERSRSGLRERGAGLVAQEQLATLLHRIGLAHVMQVGVVANERIFLDRAGTIVARLTMPQMQISWDYLYRCVRAQLEDGDYAVGRPVVAVGQAADMAWLDFSDGSRVSADLVIGADGIGSIVRSAVIEAAATPRYAGYVAWRGLIPETALPQAAAATLLDRFAFYTIPRSQALGYLVPGPDGETDLGRRRYNWVWYRRAEDLASVLTDRDGRIHSYSLSRGRVSDAARAALVAAGQQQLPPQFLGAMLAEQAPFVQAIFDLETPRMVRGRLLLLGDAAFVVRPHSAMGVAKAAGDALALVDALAGSPLEQALIRYERERLEAGRAVAAYGRRLGASMG
jgi:2-polyprenyl-6-methoxyphenol hydroxylase-like FAD-dependent oxidoreductase